MYGGIEKSIKYPVYLGILGACDNTPSDSSLSSSELDLLDSTERYYQSEVTSSRSLKPSSQRQQNSDKTRKSDRTFWFVLGSAVYCFGVILVCLTVTANAAPSTKVGGDGSKNAKWIQHKVTSGERLAEIGDHYRVGVAKIIAWNELDSKHPLLRVGQQLRIFSSIEPLVRKKTTYIVQRGDSWSKIAKRFDVDKNRLRHYWNQELPEELRPGQQVVIWVEPKRREVHEEDQDEKQNASETTRFPVVPIHRFGESIGKPSQGRLKNGVQLPENPLLYTVRDPERSWGSSYSIENLQKAVAAFRQRTGFERELIICDISLQNGGRNRPHSSHRSGRDVDIRLPLRQDVPSGTVPAASANVDWKATWNFIKALVDTGAVKYVFLDRRRQKVLYHAAQEAGEHTDILEKIIEYPGRTKTAIVRHSRGHVDHIHVRFRCDKNEKDCFD
jgi:LysM repeat protein/murein endopeptidase